MENVITYMRYSSDKQSENSIEYQRSAIQRYCASHDYNIIHEYIDEAKSGRIEFIDKRTSYAQMLKDIEKGSTPKTLIVFKYDRLGRDMVDSLTTYARLTKNHKMRIITCDGGIDTQNNGSQILVALQAALAEIEDNNISIRTRKGMYEKAKKGLYLGSGVPYGYAVNESKEYILNEDTAPYAEFIFTSYKSGKNTKEIAEDLNSRGVKTSTGKTWNHQSISTILHNEHYCGVYNYHSSDEELPDIRIENNHPAIIDKITYDMIQSMLSKNKRAAKGVSKDKPVKERYLLSGKIFCGECGATMQGFSGKTKKGIKHTYYACKNRRENKACEKEHISKDFIENYVYHSAMNFACKNPKLAENIHTLYTEKYGNDGTNEVNRQIANLEKKANNIMTITEKPEIMQYPKVLERYFKQLDDIENQIESLKNEKENIEALSQKIPSVDNIQKWLDYQCSTDTPTEENMMHMFNYFVKSVYVSNDYIVIYWRLPSDDNTTLPDYDTYVKTISEFENPSPEPERIESEQAGGARPERTLTVINYHLCTVIAL